MNKDVLKTTLLSHFWLIARRGVGLVTHTYRAYFPRMNRRLGSAEAGHSIQMGQPQVVIGAVRPWVSAVAGQDDFSGPVEMGRRLSLECRGTDEVVYCVPRAWFAAGPFGVVSKRSRAVSSGREMPKMGASLER